MSVYYNENDPNAAQWLRNLIAAGVIAQGIVDERSIEDVSPNELAGFTQCHFFAGIGVWSYALRRAGWDDDRPVWTGSCPCQPFSDAGQRQGTTDERHLWPAWFHLIRVCRPRTLFGEQVASQAGLAWFDIVRPDMEAENYAVAPADLCAACVGAPHRRQRIYFVADANDKGLEGFGEHEHRGSGWKKPSRSASETGVAHYLCGCGIRFGYELGKYGCPNCCGDYTARLIDGMADAAGYRRSGIRTAGEIQARYQAQPQTPRQLSRGLEGHSSQSGMGDTDSEGRNTRESTIAANGHRSPNGADGGTRPDLMPSPTQGYWRDADWLRCRDGRWRPVESGTFPLAPGSPTRMGRDGSLEKQSRKVSLRGYGNALNAEVATVFIEAAMECLDGRRP